MTRPVMWGLLGLVAASAAVLSFAALEGLALQCGFSPRLAWLLPLVVDAGAAAGALIWLGTASPVKALRFARTLTWVLLASSVAGNAVTHYLAAYGLRPAWWLVVMVSAVAPSVLGSVIHLAVVVSRGHHAHEHDIQLDAQEPEVDTAPLKATGLDNTVPAAPPAPSKPKRSTVVADTDRKSAETKALALVAENPTIGRRKLMADSGLSEYDARKLLEQARLETPRNGAKVLEDA